MRTMQEEWLKREIEEKMMVIDYRIVDGTAFLGILEWQLHTQLLAMHCEISQDTIDLIERCKIENLAFLRANRDEKQKMLQENEMLQERVKSFVVEQISAVLSTFDYTEHYKPGDPWEELDPDHTFGIQINAMLSYIDTRGFHTMYAQEADALMDIWTKYGGEE